ncbi:kinase-like domain-containing protein [Fennellomyces sp. T-0311]|nr:kinase-like domain-containing protein [Fennellomyces sp. T-0311]
MPFMTYLTRHTTTAPKHQDAQQKRPLPLQRKRREIGDYWLGRTIGRGASGRVKIGIHRHTGEQVAIKVISRSQLATSSTMARCVQRELAVLQLLHHPHLVDLRQVLQDSANVYFVMEYMEGGELFQVLSNRGKLPEDEARQLFRQLTTALAWCHAHHICHRDLKPENILLDKDQKHIKIADFGMAAIQSPDTLLQTSCGSPHYASPEIVRGKHYYGPATDVWSCGVILYAMLTGHLPFDDDSVSRLLAKIKTGRYIPLPSTVSREARDLIKSMLVVDPCKRISLDAVLAHPWLTNKSFLGSDLRFPDAIPLHQKPHDPLHDQDLRRPVISDAVDLDGRIWETLKVLWRDCSQEDLLAALTSEGTNVPKLTCRLLQQRAWRQENGNIAQSTALTSEDNGSSIAPMTPPLTPHCRHPYRPCEDCSSTRDSTVDTMSRTIADLPPTPKSIPAFDLDLSWHSEIHPIEVFKKRFFNEEKPPRRQHRHTLSLDRRPACPNCNQRSSDEEMLTKPADPVLVRFADVQTTLVGASSAQDHLQRLHKPQRPPQTSTKSSLLSSWLDTAWDWWTDRVSRQKQSRVFAFERPAKHECEAAGKLHQILEDHFNGKLSGRIYPTGQIVWSGSLLEQQCSMQEESIHFLCHISPSYPVTAPEDRVKINFVLVQGDSQVMENAIKRLLQIWNAYERDAKTVAAANGWL